MAILINGVVIRCCSIADIVLLNGDVVGIPVMGVTSWERRHIVMVGSVWLRIRTVKSVVGLAPHYAIRRPVGQ